MRTLKQWRLPALAAILVLLATAGVVWLSRPFLPYKIHRQVSFLVFYPESKSSARVNRASIKYDGSKKIVTYTATLGAAHLTVTNQATPSAFVDIPETYNKLLVSLHSYSDVSSASGKVAITRPPHTHDQQVAVANTQGTLIFIRADHDLSDDQWRKLFNNLKTAK